MRAGHLHCPLRSPEGPQLPRGLLLVVLHLRVLSRQHSTLPVTRHLGWGSMLLCNVHIPWHGPWHLRLVQLPRKQLRWGLLKQELLRLTSHTTGRLALHGIG